MADKYANWTLAMLRKELKERGSRLSGRKKDLVERLCALDSMGVGSREVLEEEYNMQLPPPSSFKDVHAGTKFPDLEMGKIKDYYTMNGKQLEKKFQQMYDERYLRYVRAARDNELTYFTGCVWAEMRKSVSYVVHFSIDDHGVIQEAECECPVGQGPAAVCKHVACTMYGINRMSTTGTILTEQTCTQTLQTFHHAKPFKGSPMPASKLQELRGQHLSTDPRPEKFRNDAGFSSRVRAIVTNYQAQHPDQQMPILQMYEPANPYAINVDHDYGTSSVEAFLNREKLHDISPTELETLEVLTRGQAENKLWKLARSVRLTASNFGTICKAVRRDMKKLASQLLNPVEFHSRATSHGRLYEKVAVQQFEQLVGPTQECGLFVCEAFPFLGASPDRVVDESSIVEVKCPYASKGKPINETTVPYLRKTDNGLQLSNTHNYYYQVQGQLLCSGRDRCYFCVFTIADFLVLQIERDDVFIPQMAAELKTFYEQYFQPELLNQHVFKNYDRYF